MKAQDTVSTVISDFEDGVMSWSTWGAPLSIETNPDMTGNASDSVALLDQSNAAWSGMAKWSDDGMLNKNVQKVILKAYMKNTGGTLKLQCDNSISGGANIEKYIDLDADTWVDVEFDISAEAVKDHKQLAFQSGVADSLFIDSVVIYEIIPPVPEYPAELVDGGNMEDSTVWISYLRDDRPDTSIMEFNYTDSVPSEGAGGCLKITTSGYSGAFVKQEVDVKPGHEYTFTGAFASMGEDTIANSWLELILTPVEPIEDAEFGSNDAFVLYSMNTWAGDSMAIDGTFQDDFTVGTSNFVIPETYPASTKWYVLIKAGSDNASTDKPVMEYLFDELSLIDHGISTMKVIDNIVDGAVDSAADYTCLLDVQWDADSVYMVFDITDDTIYTASGADYTDDNIEVYFDLDNSKNINWPRNAGTWPVVSYDTNDYQLRIKPGGDWDALNGAAGVGSAAVNYAHDTTDDGYTFMLNICWDSLLSGFEPAAGTEIGFDILASDNDGSGRNQITWNAVSANIWTDANLMASVELVSDTLSAFILIPDTEVPSDPTNLAEADQVLTWDASTDNIGVYQYRIKVGSDVDTVLWAKESGNTFTVDLADGDYIATVMAIDVNGNKSANDTAEFTVGDGTPAINITEISSFNVYPNPSNGIFNIVSEESNDVSLAVYNVAGQQIFTDVFNKNYTLNLTEAQSGMYIVHLNNGEKVEVVNLIVR